MHAGMLRQSMIIMNEFIVKKEANKQTNLCINKRTHEWANESSNDQSTCLSPSLSVCLWMNRSIEWVSYAYGMWIVDVWIIWNILIPPTTDWHRSNENIQNDIVNGTCGFELFNGNVISYIIHCTLYQYRPLYSLSSVSIICSAPYRSGLWHRCAHIVLCFEPYTVILIDYIYTLWNMPYDCDHFILSMEVSNRINSIY